MSLITRFTELCAKFRLTESQLRAAIESGASTRATARLLRRNAALLERLETFNPETRGELNEFIDFIASRRVESVQVNDAWRPDILAALNTMDPNTLQSDPPWVPASVRLPHPLPDTMEADDVARMVLGTAAQVSVLSLFKRVLTVSSPVAALWRSTPTRMSGLHLRDIIGCELYFNRERDKIDRAISEGPQTFFYHDTLSSAEQKASHVRMVPIKDRSGQTYAVLRTSTSQDPARP